MRVFLVKTFRRYQRRQGIDDDALADAVRRAERGKIDAVLGGGLIKQRVARSGGGKSGGYRTIIAYRQGNRAAFLLGFAKNERDNVDDDVLDDLKKLGAAVLDNDEAAIGSALQRGTLTEVRYGDQDQEHG